MKSKIIAALAALTLLAAACQSEPAPSRSVAPSSPTPVSSLAASSSEEPASSEEPVSSLALSSAPAIEAPTEVELSSLSNEKQGWGQENRRNERNQPTKCLTYQERYRDRAAVFINDSEAIALTFDEGYANDTTATILDTLKEKNVKATFFLTHEFASKCPDLVQRMIDEGHTLGNHSWTHYSLPTKSFEVARDEITKQHDFVQERFGYTMHLFRPPQGEFSDRTLEMTKRLGYTTVFWSYAYKDYDLNNQYEPDTAKNMILNAAHPGAIYLLHAASPTNAAILGDVIDGFRAKGFDFTTL